MNKLEILEEELVCVENELKSITARKTELLRKVHKAKKLHAQEIFNLWDVHEGSCFVMFTKDKTAYYTILTCSVTQVDEVESTLVLREGQYICSYDLCFKLNYIHHNFAHLRTFEKDFNIYVVDRATLADLEAQLLTLTITINDIEKLESSIACKAIRRIS